MEIKKGIGVSPGVVIGTAVVLDAEDVVVPRRQVEVGKEAAELERVHRAFAQAEKELTELRDQLARTHGQEVSDEISGIFTFHIGVLNDKDLHRQIISEIEKNHWTAEYAVSVVMRRYANRLAALPDKYFSE